MGKLGVSVRLGGRTLDYGAGEPQASLVTDTATFVRICGGRDPDPARYQLEGDIAVAELILFS